MSVATIIVKAEAMPCHGERWEYLVGTKSEVIQASCQTCYHAGWRCQYGVR